MEDLKQVCGDMKKEIGQRQMESKNLKEDLDNVNRQIQNEAKALEGTLETLEKYKVLFILILHERDCKIDCSQCPIYDHQSEKHGYHI